jgi:hypothetical protein
MSNTSKVAELLENATYYVSAADGWFRIDGVEAAEEEFYCWDEDSGEQYCVPFSDVDIAADDFYELRKMAK